MIMKDYTTKPLRVHDNDYPWYRPGHIPAHTCSYPYEFAYPHSYPTYSVTQTSHLERCTCFDCMQKAMPATLGTPNVSDPLQNKEIIENKSVYEMLWMVFLIVLGVMLISSVVF